MIIHFITTAVTIVTYFKEGWSLRKTTRKDIGDVTMLLISQTDLVLVFDHQLVVHLVSSPYDMRLQIYSVSRYHYHGLLYGWLLKFQLVHAC